MNWGIIADNLLKGMGAAGWCIGFMALMGAFLILVGVMVTAAIYATGGVKDEEDDE